MPRGTEGIHQSAPAPPASREGSLWGTNPSGFTTLQSSCNFVFHFAVSNILLYLFIRPLMLRGSPGGCERPGCFTTHLQR